MHLLLQQSINNKLMNNLNLNNLKTTQELLIATIKKGHNIAHVGTPISYIYIYTNRQ